MVKKVYLKIAPTTGDPTTPIPANEQMFLGGGRTTLDTGFDLRDRLTELVGKGNTLNPDDKASIYSNLTALVGKDRATKLMQHAYIFNTRPEIQKLPLEEKIQAFYNLGSQDADVQDVIAKTKNLGYGVKQGFRTSSSQLNQELAGRIPSTVVAETPETKKVILRVTK